MIMAADVMDYRNVYPTINLHCARQAFALGDEQEETSPDEELLTMTLLKHQVCILETPCMILSRYS